MTGFTALILAGSRGGPEPVANYAGVAHKALIPVDGTPMILRVVAALGEAGASRIAVSTDETEVMALLAGYGVECMPPSAQPSLSVLSAFEALGAPLLVTTADHALLRPEWITQFLADMPPECDLALLLAERRVVEADAPRTRRTWYRFGRRAWSGCNLFYLATPKAADALALWRTVEVHRKQPWRVARLIGLTGLARYLGGRRPETGSAPVREPQEADRFGVIGLDCLTYGQKIVATRLDLHVVGVIGRLAIDGHDDVGHWGRDQSVCNSGLEQGVPVQQQNVLLEPIAYNPAGGQVVGHPVKGVVDGRDRHGPQFQSADLVLDQRGPETGDHDNLFHARRLKMRQLPGQQAAPAQFHQAFRPCLC